MDRVLIEDPQHRVDHQHRHQQQPAHPPERLGEDPRIALEIKAAAGRQQWLGPPADLLAHPIERLTRPQVEGEVHRGQLVGVVHRHQAGRFGHLGEAGEGHQGAAAAADRQLVEVAAAALVRRHHAAQHRVLAIAAQDLGDLPLAVAGRQGRLHIRHRHPQRRGPLPVDAQIQLGVGGQQVVVELRDARDLPQAALQAAAQPHQVGELGGLQRELISGPAAGAADVHRRRQPREAPQARHRVHAAPQVFHHLLRRLPPLGAGLELHEQPPAAGRGVRPALADRAVHPLHRRMGEHLAAQPFMQLGHRGEAHPLGRLGRHRDLAGVDIGDEALGNQQKEHQAQAHQQQREGLGGPGVPQGLIEGAGVGAGQPLELLVEGRDQPLDSALASAQQPPEPLEAPKASFRRPGRLPLRRRTAAAGGLLKAGAQHRRESEPHQAGEGNRHAEGDGELPEQPPQQAPHQQDRQEHRHQRDGHRHDRWTDLLGTPEGRRTPIEALLLQPGDRFHHHHGVVHHEAHAQGEGHQGEVVERKAQHGHHREGADQRHRDRQAGDQGGGGEAQEEHHHPHHQQHALQQRLLHVVDGGPDAFGAVVEHPDRDGGGDPLPQLGQHLKDALVDRHRVAAGLALHRQHDRAHTVEAAGQPFIGHAVAHLGHIGQPDRGAVAVGHHQVGEGGGIKQAAVVADRIGALGRVEGARRNRGVGALHRRHHVVHPQLARRQLLGAHLHPHRIFLGPEDVHLGHAAEHREPLGDLDLRGPIHLRERQHRGGEYQIEDRLLGRIHLAHRRRIGHAGRQLPLRLGDGGLHVLGGGVDIAGEVELQGDLAARLGAAGGHRGEARQAGELLLQGQGHGAGHGFRIRPRQRSAHLQGGEIDVGQVADRQLAVAHQARQHQGEAEQQGGDRPADRRRGEVHGCRCCLGRLPAADPDPGWPSPLPPAPLPPAPLALRSAPVRSGPPGISAN